MDSIKEYRPKAIDLFCGCGGISSGLRSAGFRIIAGVDVDPKYIATFRHNFPNTLALRADLTQTSPTSLMSDLGIAPEELDVLAGGPPCQGFSKNVPRRLRSENSASNLMVRTFLSYCEVLKPKLVLMENVAEMRNGFSHHFNDEIFDRLRLAGYSVTSTVINAAEYGIPQRRRRVFFLAVRGEGKLEPPTPTHKRTADEMGLWVQRPFISVWEAIGDLPSLKHGEGESESEYAVAPFTDYQLKMRGGTKTVRNHVARRLSAIQYARLSSLLPGQGHKDLPKELQVRGGYSGAYGRLTKDMVAPTITRWVFHPGSGRWGHPVDVRTLTIREAARIQGFYDDYEFKGSFAQQSGQVGNAVPPLLAEQIGRSMRAQLGI